MGIIVPCEEQFKAATDSIMLKFTRDFIEKSGGTTRIKKDHPLHKNSSLKSRKSHGSGQKKGLLHGIHEEKEVSESPNTPE